MLNETFVTFIPFTEFLFPNTVYSRI